MAVNTDKLIEHLVVDTGAFIKRARLETFGSHVYTLPEVIGEIKDRQTREFIKSLPFPILIESPTIESIKIVSNLAKKTGDFSVLSHTDIKVVALAYEVYKRNVGQSPQFKEVKEIPNNLGQQARECAMKKRQIIKSEDEKDVGEKRNFECDSALDDEDEEEGDDESLSFSACSLPTDLDFEPDEEDWITEDNFDEKAHANFGLAPTFLNKLLTENEEPARISVGCLTTDFPMQNLLFHAGLEIITLNGMRIREPRTFLLWCCACYTPTKRTNTYFCPSCGHASLNRIPVTLREDGNLEFHFSRHYRPSHRGLQQPIRKPQGGKYSDEPIYCADQRLPDRRPPRPKNANVVPIASNGLLDLDDDPSDLTDVFDFRCNLNSTTSFFLLNDISSRAMISGLRSDHQIPPKRFGYCPNHDEHGLKPTRGTAHLVKPRTGNKNRRNKKLNK